jgi:hypothetical protein
MSDHLGDSKTKVARKWQQKKTRGRNRAFSLESEVTPPGIEPIGSYFKVL